MPIHVIRENNFERSVKSFVASNKTFSKGYIYDYNIDGLSAEIFVVGAALDPETEELLMASAERHGLQREQIKIKEHSFGTDRETSEQVLRTLNERAEAEIVRKDGEIKRLERQIDALRGEEIPYAQIAREVKYQFPAIKDITISRGASVSTDSLKVRNYTQVLATTGKEMRRSEVVELQNWLQIRLADSTVVVNNLVRK